MKFVFYFDQNVTEFCFKGYNCQLTGIGFDWCWLGDKPLSEPMLTRLTDAYMRHQGRGVNILGPRKDAGHSASIKRELSQSIFYADFDIPINLLTDTWWRGIFGKLDLKHISKRVV